MKREEIPYFAVNEPYELFYRNSAAAYPVSAHTHNAAELYLTLTNLPDVLLNDTVSGVRKGTLVLIPPFCVHQLYHRKDEVYERYILNIDIQWLEKVFSCMQDSVDYLKWTERPLILPLNEQQLSVLTKAMNRFLPMQKERNIKAVAEFMALLSVLDSVVREARMNFSLEKAVVTGTQKTVNEIISYINEHLMEGVTLAQIAAHFYMNKDYLSRLFMKHTHTSIGHYTAMQRIARAQELLREGKTVAEVQEIMGYSSYAYFFKTFQKMTGISPSRYRMRYMTEPKE